MKICDLLFHIFDHQREQNYMNLTYNELHVFQHILYQSFFDKYYKSENL